jgi:hypothetical protein
MLVRGGLLYFPEGLTSGGSQRWPRIKGDSRAASNKVGQATREESI